VGLVGDDDLEQIARQGLIDEGVNVAALGSVASPTGVALIVVDVNGENQIAVAPGANAEVSADTWPADLEIARGDVLLASFEIGDEAVVSAAQRAAAAAATVVVNPAPARELPVALLHARPILVPNEIEAQELTGETDPLAAGRVLAARSGTAVVVTLGPRGAAVIAEGEVTSIPAPLVQAVDTVGAGDAFAGALAAELATGSQLLDAARFAVHAASLSVTRPGARGGMPSRAEVAASLERAAS
jgi:ribokinase